MNVNLCLTCWKIRGPGSAWYLPVSEGEHNTGIGNVLFQVASGLNYAYKNNAKLHAPTLNTFLQHEGLDKENTIFRNVSTKLLPSYSESTKKNHPNWRGSIFDLPFENNLTLEGYFENVDNFYSYRKTLLDTFRPNEDDKEYLYAKHPVLKDNDSLTSIHIRRGADWRQLVSEDKQRALDDEMLRALDFMVSAKGVRNVFVLTNDKEHSESLFKNYKSLNFYYSNERDYHDIWIISLIKNNIISQSTLAWWGSFLNENDDKYLIVSRGHNRIPCPDFNVV